MNGCHSTRISFDQVPASDPNAGNGLEKREEGAIMMPLHTAETD